METCSSVRVELWIACIAMVMVCTIIDNAWWLLELSYGTNVDWVVITGVVQLWTYRRRSDFSDALQGSFICLYSWVWIDVIAGRRRDLSSGCWLWQWFKITESGWGFWWFSLVEKCSSCCGRKEILKTQWAII